MSTITTRSGKGSPLTHNEVDANFTNLNTDKYQSGDDVTFGSFTSTGIDDNATSTALTVTDSGIAATLTTAAQPNITSVGTLTGFTSTGIDDNATSTAITIDSGGNVTIDGSDASTSLASTAILNLKAGDANNEYSILRFATSADGSIAYIGAKATTTGAYPSSVGNLEFGVQNGASTVTAMTINNSGLVGIGTASPSFAGFGSSTGGIDITNSNNASLRLNGNAADAMFFVSGSGQHWLYGRGAVPMTFSTNATERMRIDSSGNVGIGATSPSTILANVSASAKGLAIESAVPAIAVKDTSAADDVGYIYQNANDFHFLNYAGGNTIFTYGASYTEAMRIDSSGNVGIGTTSPSGGLHVKSSTDITTFESTTDGLYNTFTSTAGTFGYLGSGSQTVSGAATTDFGIQAVTGNFVLATGGNTERMRIDSSGNVGIGTTTPNSAGNYYAGWGLSLGANRTFIGTTSGGDSVLGGASGSAYTAFHSNGTERMRIDSSGLVLAGVTSSTYHTFSLNNSGNYAAGVVNTNPSAPYGLVISLSGVSSGGGAGFLTCVDGNANRLLIRGDGDVENVNNSYGAISDERVKSNIVDASSQIDDIMAVQVRSYTLNETGDTHIGVVAQELEASGMSGLVQEDDEGMKSVKYSILYMKAIKALQEAVTRIETLEAEVAALKGA